MNACRHLQAEAKIRRNTMTDNKQFQQVNQAIWDMVNSFREANRTLADSVMAIHDHNLRFAQNTFLSWMELLTHQTESVQHVQQQGGPQIQKLMPPSMQIYMDFLLAPFTLSRKLIEASMTAAQREREPVEASMIAAPRERELVP
jgi:hypothetical protein